MSTEEIRISVDAGTEVSGLLDRPDEPVACLVLSHGAGAGMRHAFMANVASGLAERRIATLRYQFPYMERGSRRPDTPKLAHAAVRAAIGEARRRLSDVPLFAGGKSFGGRMTSQAQAAEPLQGVRGLVFLGFPLHPAGKPSIDRAEHLGDVHLPMLFLQGSRDDLANLDLLQPVVGGLAPHARLVNFEDADHSFHVPKRTGRSDAEVMAELLDAMAAWMVEITGTPS